MTNDKDSGGAFAVPAPRYRVIADRDKGDDPTTDDIFEGDRVTYGLNGWGQVVPTRIERPVPTTDDPKRRLRVVDIDKGVIDEDNNEVTFALSELDEQPSPSLPTREQIAAQLEDLHARWHDQPGNLFGRDECGWEGCDFYAAAEFALIQNGADHA